MELCRGDLEEYLKHLPNESLPPEIARAYLFQVAFALYVAADRFSLKHYDVKLLNCFVKDINAKGSVVLRYGFGSHIFALKMPAEHAKIMKVAGKKQRRDKRWKPIRILIQSFLFPLVLILSSRRLWYGQHSCRFKWKACNNCTVHNAREYSA